jgi:7-cyano-7-deazaguanine synthase
MGVPYKSTWTCYNGREKACGVCDACKERLQGFKELGVNDPMEYETLTDETKK